MARRFAIYGLRVRFIAVSSAMNLIDQNSEALRGAVAWALQLADQQGNTLVCNSQTSRVTLWPQPCSRMY